VTTGDPLRQWRDDLAAWAIPERILARAEASPWTPELDIFIRRAEASRRRPNGISFDRGRDALPPGGSVLDVGAGAGAASLPLLDRASTLVAVDQDEQLLAELVKQAGLSHEKVTTVAGSWPAVASAVAAANVVVCHHVLYNVPELRPFIDALDAHARNRVVIEITAAHPVARLNPLWERFHGLTRPVRPIWEDARQAIRSFHAAVQVERSQVPADAPAATWEELVRFTTRRLCLPREREGEVAAVLTELGTVPDDPSSWSPSNREVVTLWWDRA